MSMTYSTDVTEDELEAFLLEEHTKGTGIPVHPFRAICCAMPSMERTLGIANDQGTLFVNDYEMTAYGMNNRYEGMVRALRSCGVDVHFVW